MLRGRLPKHNALSVSLQKQLHEAVRAVRFDDEGRVLIITGAGNTFSARRRGRPGGRRVAA